MNMEKLSIPFAIIIAGCLIAGSLYLSNIKSAQQLQQLKNAPATSQVSAAMRPVSADDHILGNPNAQILLVEYSDTECPYCKVFQTTLHRMISEYGPSGEVAWVYRHFPISQLHSKSEKEAEATECANEIGGPTKFWQYLDEVYAITNSNDSLNPAELPIIAKDVGLDVTAFNTCLSSGKYSAKVQADYDDAIKTGGQGTPHSILITKNGTETPIDGAYPYDQLKTILDAALGK